jgi:hypothetical protein
MAAYRGWCPALSVAATPVPSRANRTNIKARVAPASRVQVRALSRSLISLNSNSDAVGPVTSSFLTFNLVSTLTSQKTAKLTIKNCKRGKIVGASPGQAGRNRPLT